MPGKRLFVKRPSGYIDLNAPFWKGDTAERIITERRNRVRTSSRWRRSSSRSTSGVTPSQLPDSSQAALKTLRRLERVMPTRKTLAARQRLKKRIESLKKEFDLE